jgi:hypothetical protein
MNITTPMRLFVTLMVTGTVALAAAPDQTAALKIDQTPADHGLRSVANDPFALPAPQQHVALLIAPDATTRSQVRDWNNPQSAQSSDRQMADAEDSASHSGSLVLPVVNVYSRPTVIKYLPATTRDKLLSHYAVQP